MYWSPRGRIFVLHSILLISSCFTLTKISKILGRPWVNPGSTLGRPKKSFVEKHFGSTQGRPWVDPGSTQNNISFYFQIIQPNHKQVMNMKYSAPGGLDKGLNQLWFQWKNFWGDFPIELHKLFYDIFHTFLEKAKAVKA